MEMAVQYYSKSGNTKKLANAIAKEVGCRALTIDEELEGKVDLLFLGASVYWNGIDKKVKDYIKSLNPLRVKRVAIFSTSAMAERAFPEIKKLLMEKGITVEERNYYCRGQFTAMHRGRPNEDDLKQAEEFAKTFLEEGRN
ncbi:hypothetical protein lbkm_2198 [Lachnospiraceae bacterium KM106-2]|nr:hypothetical protein lbkm_2198 [Lachnospiraceae bacterium KM106-2]